MIPATRPASLTCLTLPQKRKLLYLELLSLSEHSIWNLVALMRVVAVNQKKKVVPASLTSCFTHAACAHTRTDACTNTRQRLTFFDIFFPCSKKFAKHGGKGWCPSLSALVSGLVSGSGSGLWRRFSCCGIISCKVVSTFAAFENWLNPKS